jgi:hypothetical protein
MLSHLRNIEKRIEKGKIEQAIKELQHLRERVDGCGTEPEPNDWIVDCAVQLQVRTVLDLFIANLEASLPAAAASSSPAGLATDAVKKRHVRPTASAGRDEPAASEDKQAKPEKKGKPEDAGSKGKGHKDKE